MLDQLQTLVFQFAGQPNDSVAADACDSGWIAANQSSVSLLFAEDAERRRVFLRFLRKGAWGLFLVRNGVWAAYGWIAPPAVTNPPHLPRWARSLGAHWIFYCHTRAEYRRRGFYKSLLMRLVRTVHGRMEDPLILCDTLPENIASRGALLQSGFVPKGTVTAYRLDFLPFGGVTFGGRWDLSEPHRPEMAMTGSAAERAAS